MILYKIHFGSSKQSQFYPQALELAAQAPVPTLIEDGENNWYTGVVKKDQLDLMFHIYCLALKLPNRTVYDADSNYLYVS